MCVCVVLYMCVFYIYIYKGVTYTLLYYITYISCRIDILEDRGSFLFPHFSLFLFISFSSPDYNKLIKIIL